MGESAHLGTIEVPGLYLIWLVARNYGEGYREVGGLWNTANVCRLKDSDVVTAMMEELADKFPGIAQPLITERDMYLSYTMSHSPGPVVIGVVGLGYVKRIAASNLRRHLKGIEKYWNEEIRIADISRIPQDKGNLNLKVVIGSLLAVAALATSAVTYWVGSYFFW